MKKVFIRCILCASFAYALCLGAGCSNTADKDKKAAPESRKTGKAQPAEPAPAKTKTPGNEAAGVCIELVDLVCSRCGDAGVKCDMFKKRFTKDHSPQDICARRLESLKAMPEQDQEKLWRRFCSPTPRQRFRSGRGMKRRGQQ